MAEQFSPHSTNTFVSPTQSNVYANNPFVDLNHQPNSFTNPFVEYPIPQEVSTNPFITHSTEPFVNTSGVKSNDRNDGEHLRQSSNDAEVFIDKAYRKYCVQGRSFSKSVPPPVPPRVRPSHSTAIPRTLINDMSPIPSIDFSPLNTKSVHLKSNAPASQAPLWNTEEVSSKQLLKELVDQFTTAVQESRNASSMTSKVKLLPPRFDEHGDVHLFIKQFVEVAKLCGWDDQVALVQLRSSLERKAMDCARGDSLKEVFSRLLAMFGLTPLQAREKLHSLERKPSESYRAFGDRVDQLSQLAYGGLSPEVEKQLALEHFDCAIADPTLRRHLLAVKPGKLEDAIQAAEEYDRVGPSSMMILNQPRVAPVVKEQDRMPQHCSWPNDTEKVLGRLSTQLDSISRRLEALEGLAMPKQRSGRNCFYCQEPGHFKRSCPLLKAESGVSGKADGSATTNKIQGN